MGAGNSITHMFDAPGQDTADRLALKRFGMTPGQGGRTMKRRKNQGIQSKSVPEQASLLTREPLEILELQGFEVRPPWTPGRQ